MPRIIRPLVSPAGRLVLLSGGTVWLIAAVALSPAQELPGPSAVPGQVLLTLERPGGVAEPLYKARVLTLTPEGDLLVCDSGNGRVLRLDPQGRLVRLYGRPGQGPGELSNPRGAAADGEGSVFVADPTLGRITKYAADGTYLTSVPHPRASTVLVASAGHVLVWPGRGEALLERYGNDLSGGEPVLRKWRPRQHVWTDVLFALDRQDRLYVLDQQELAVRVYDRALRELRRWAVDPPGLREDLDRRLEEVRRLSPVAGINPILHLSLDARGERLIMTYRNGRTKTTTVYIYTLDGSLERQLEGVGTAFGATLDRQRRLVAADGFSLKVLALSGP